MISVTEQKPIEEIMKYLDKYQSVYVIGCGSRTTITHTGGKAEVLEMKEKLEAAGKKVTGWMVIPTACDELTGDALTLKSEEIEAADSILVMSCAYGVQTVNRYLEKPVFPAVDTMFIGKEMILEQFTELCMQCGECVIGQYAGICPMTWCAKNLLCGPCGGTREGKCEQEPEHDCAWVLIYDRMKKLGRLDELKGFAAPKDYSKLKRPRQQKVSPS